MKSRQGKAGASMPENGGSKRRSRVLLAAMAVVCVCALPQVSSAEASTVSVGSVLPLDYTPTQFGQVETLFNTTLPEKGANLTSPASGVIVRWRVLGASGGPFYLRVLHPNGSGAYEATQTSTGSIPSSTELQTFTTNIPIKSGDLIGIDSSHATDEIGVATAPGANSAFIFPPPFNGATVAPSGTEAGKEIELSAEIQPTPSIISLEGFSGSIAGGTQVTIHGENLTGTSVVKFGANPAAGFTVDSDTQITATAPKSSVSGYADVTVTTPAGTSPTARGDRFRYEACVVPKLKGKTLPAARRALKRADCKLGKVKGKSGKVAGQSTKQGKVKLPGTKVGVRLEETH